MPFITIIGDYLKKKTKNKDEKVQQNRITIVVILLNEKKQKIRVSLVESN